VACEIQMKTTRKRLLEERDKPDEFNIVVITKRFNTTNM
jgi:hypothetical protein